MEDYLAAATDAIAEAEGNNSDLENHCNSYPDDCSAPVANAEWFSGPSNGEYRNCAGEAAVAVGSGLVSIGTAMVAADVYSGHLAGTALISATMAGGLALGVAGAAILAGAGFYFWAKCAHVLEPLIANRRELAALTDGSLALGEGRW